MTRNPRVLLGAIAGGLVVIILLWFVFLYNPKGNDISDVRDQVQQAQQQEQSLRATLERLKSIDENRPALEAELRKLKAAVPPQPELASFILAMHDAAAKADITFTSLTPALPAEGPGDTSVIAVGIQVNGPFFSVLDYLDRLQELERVLVVDSVQLSASAPQAEPSATAASVAGVTEGTAQSTTSTTSNPEQVVTVTTPNGDVVTDNGSLATTTTTSLSDLVAAATQVQAPTIPKGPYDIQMQLQARLFTTAAPAGQGGASTTTSTAPGGTTTTTTAGGG